jgi:hypothetical protein
MRELRRKRELSDVVCATSSHRTGLFYPTSSTAVYLELFLRAALMVIDAELAVETFDPVGK